VPNALYWKGETHYARQQYNEAIFAFKDVQTRFPRDAKTPDSLLKTAMAYSRLGDEANASLHLTVLYEDWPNAEAIARARQMGLKP
jgi:TolA-binding protein